MERKLRANIFCQFLCVHSLGLAQRSRDYRHAKPCHGCYSALGIAQHTQAQKYISVSTENINLAANHFVSCQRLSCCIAALCLRRRRTAVLSVRVSYYRLAHTVRSVTPGIASVARCLS